MPLDLVVAGLATAKLGVVIGEGLKLLGLKTAFVKASVIAVNAIHSAVGTISGFSIAVKGKAILMIAKSAIGVAQQLGWVGAAKYAGQMLMLISSVTFGKKVAKKVLEWAYKCLVALKNRKKKKAKKYARKALSHAGNKVAVAY